MNSGRPISKRCLTSPDRTGKLATIKSNLPEHTVTHTLTKDELAKLTFHPASEILPLMTGAEYDELVADMRENGLIEPITLCDNMVLDGRNRLEACNENGIEPVFTTYSGNNPTAWVISKNIKRRHLTTSQRAAVAAEAADMILDERNAAAAAAGLPAPHHANLKQHKAGSGVVNSQPRAVVVAGEAAGVGEQAVSKALRVKRTDPELHAAVKAGKITVNAAADALDLLPALEKRGLTQVVEQVRAGKVPISAAKRSLGLGDTEKKPKLKVVGGNGVHEPVGALAPGSDRARAEMLGRAISAVVSLPAVSHFVGGEVFTSYSPLTNIDKLQDAINRLQEILEVYKGRNAASN